MIKVRFRQGMTMTHNTEKLTIPVHEDWTSTTATFTTWHLPRAIWHVTGYFYSGGRFTLFPFYELSLDKGGGTITPYRKE
jgi:hypothetical protein